MTKLASMLAAAALAAIPLAARAQDHHGDRTGGHDHYARSAASHGYDASARSFDRHDGRGVWRGDNHGRAYGYGYRQGDGRRFNHYDGGRFHSSVTFGLGLGYGGYYPYGGDYPYAGYNAYGGYYDAGAYPVGGYGADDTHSYPDEYGTYQPFSYDYSPRDDAYYAGAPDDDRADGDGDYDDEAANDGWSAGGPPADCGRWVWRADRGAYEWAPAPCR